jgi:translation initiation factor IF-2
MESPADGGTGYRVVTPVRPPSSRPVEPPAPMAPAAEVQAPAPTALAAEAAPPASPMRMMAPVRPPQMKQAAAPQAPAAASQAAAEPVDDGTQEADEVRGHREAPMLTPSSMKTVVSKEISTMADRPTTREPMQRRGGTIVGRKELPAPAARTTDGRSGPRVPVIQHDGMVQTTSEGSKRTFVRSRTDQMGPKGRGRGPMMMPPGMRGAPQHGRQKSASGTPATARPASIEIKMPITVKDLSSAMGVKSNEIIQKLLRDHGKLATLNMTLDKDTVELLGLDFECEIKVGEAHDLEKSFIDEQTEAFTDDPADLAPRPPIITFLGHVDHGKTSLLDYIRKTRVAEREHGGITQHIGAWRVSVPTGDVVFLDTPGHKAFTEMRARGATLTDVVVLVVAADDGVMPQTEEAIAHARAAGVEIVVAVNKIDKPEANPMQVRQQLVGLGLQPEEWGGTVGVFDVSALTGQGIDKLLEYLAVASDMLELKANPKRPAEATVIEAMQKKGEGNVVRLVITNGTLRRGDSFLCGQVFGKVKAIRLGGTKVVSEAGPAWPVEIGGLAELPQSGDKFFVVRDVEKAKNLAAERTRQLRDKKLNVTQHVNLESLLKQAATGQLNLVLKVDTTGSLEVLKKSIMELSHAEIQPRIIHSAVGPVTETDVTLADASDAVILGFHVTDSAAARRLAEDKGVEIRHYHVIYKLIDELKEALEGRLAPEEKEVITGHVEVRQIFRVSKIGTIAGCYVQDGVIRRTARVRLMRNGILIHEGKIESLKHMKDDVKEITEGRECGIRIDGYDDIKVGDTIEPYEIEKVKRTLSS